MLTKMFDEVIYYPILGIPLIVYGGIATAYATRKGIWVVAVKWHYRLAYLGMALGFLHGLFGLISYL